MSEITIVRRPNGYMDWSQMSDKDSKSYILEEMKKYASPTAFNKACSGISLVIQKKGWKNELYNNRGWKLRINWSKMGKKEGVKLMKEIALKYTNISLFVKEQGGIAQKAQEWGVYNSVTGSIPRVYHNKFILASMSHDEQLDYCKTVAKECDSRTEFTSTQRLISKLLKELGSDIYEETMREIFGEKKHYTNPAKDRDGFSKLCKKIDPGEPYLIHKVSQMVAYYVPRMSDSHRNYFFDNISMKFFDSNYLEEIWCVPLSELWTWDWGAHKKVLDGFSIILKMGAIDGLDVPIRSNYLETKQLMLQNIIDGANPFEPETIGQLFAKDDMIHENINFLVLAIRTIGNTKLSGSDLPGLLGTIELCKTKTAKEKETQQTALKKSIANLIEHGQLPKSFNEFENSMVKAYKAYRESRNTPIKKRTLDWYFFKMYKDWWHDIDNESITRRNQLTSHYNSMPRVMPNKLTPELFKKITGRKKRMLEFMIEDRVLSDIFFKKETEEYSFADETWKIDGKIINFTRISNKSIRAATMAMCKKLLKTNRPSTLGTYVTQAQHLDDFLKECKIASLIDFNQDYKQKFYDYSNKLAENDEYNKAAGLVKFVRKLYKTLNTPKKRKGLVSPDLNFHPSEYSAPKKPKDYNYPIFSDAEMKKILVHLDNVQKMAPHKRIPRTATILQLLIARRAGETVALDTNCIIWLGNSGDWILKYWSTKQNAMKKVSVSILTGDRNDPFALVIRDMVPRLVKELIDLTQTLRALAPEKIKNKLFIRYSRVTSAKEPIIVETANRIGAEWATIKKELDINKSITLHDARHTMATRLLRTGSDFALAAEALGDAIGTIKNSYSATVSKLETMSLPRGHLINDISSDVKQILETKYSSPKPVNTSEISECDNRHDVCGGSCGAGSKKMHACETYLLTKGGNGCKGCSMFFPSPLNLPFWSLELRSDYLAMQKSKGTIAYGRKKLNYLRTENLVITLKEMDND